MNQGGGGGDAAARALARTRAKAALRRRDQLASLREEKQKRIDSEQGHLSRRHSSNSINDNTRDSSNSNGTTSPDLRGSPTPDGGHRTSGGFGGGGGRRGVSVIPCYIPENYPSEVGRCRLTRVFAVLSTLETKI